MFFLFFFPSLEVHSAITLRVSGGFNYVRCQREDLDLRCRVDITAAGIDHFTSLTLFGSVPFRDRNDLDLLVTLDSLSGNANIEVRKKIRRFIGLRQLANLGKEAPTLRKRERMERNERGSVYGRGGEGRNRKGGGGAKTHYTRRLSVKSINQSKPYVPPRT